MTTRVYGCSDDLVEIEGELEGEISSFENEVLLAFSDNTLLLVEYNKGIWKITEIRRGDLFDRVDVCTDPDAEIYSDQAFFFKGLEWCYLARFDERITKKKSKKRISKKK